MSDEAGMGFLEEKPGVKSATRLSALAMTAGALCIVLAACVVAIRGGPDAATIIGVLAAPLVPLAAGIWAALKERD